MGDVIFFQPTRKVAQSDRTAPPRDATILFFTGVRYQRYIEPPAAPIEQAPPNGGMDGAGGRRRRKRG
jgi:hypothetical protein